MRVLVPDFVGQEQEKRIRVVCSLRGPVPTFLFRIYDMALEDLLVRINKFPVFFSVELILVDLVDLRRDVSIVQVDSIDFVLLNELNNLVEKQVPSLFLPVVENRTLLVAYSSPLTSIEEVLVALLVDAHQFEVLVLFAHPGGTHAGETVNNKSYVVLF